MATTGGSDGDGYTRFVNRLMTVACGVAIAGVSAIVAFAWNSNTTLTQISSDVQALKAAQMRQEQYQIARDGEQDKWIDYFRERLDSGRSGPVRPSVRGRGSDD